MRGEKELHLAPNLTFMRHWLFWLEHGGMKMKFMCEVVWWINNERHCR